MASTGRHGIAVRRFRLPVASWVLGAAILGGVSVGPADLDSAPVAWSATTSGQAKASSQTMPTGTAPTPVATGTSVTVTWPVAKLSGGTSANGYRIRRFASGTGVEQVVLSGCAGTVTALTCTENLVPAGSWRYTVTPLMGAWTGTQSAQSAPVTVGTASLSFTSPTTVQAAALPATLSGSIAGFLPSEGLSFHLDSATGTLLSGTPATVPGSGGGAVTVTLPTGLAEGQHSVFAVGSTGTAANAVVMIVDPPRLSSLQMYDDNGNGKVDRVLATFDRTLAAYTAGTAPWTLTSAPSQGALASVSVSGSAATLTLTEGAGAPATGVGAFTVALAADPNGIRSAGGSQASFAATAPTDRATPVVTTLRMLDGNGNGKIDSISAAFSETLASYTAGTTPWTVTGIPSAGTFTAVIVSGSTATLTIAEGAGAADTAVGSLTVALATSATGIRDAAGNPASFTARAPQDAAAPATLSLGMYDDDANGYVARVRATYSESLAPYSAGNAPWTLANAPSGATLNTVTVSSNTVSLLLNEGPAAPATGVGSFTVALAANANGVRDAAGNQTVMAITSPADAATPVRVGLTMLDANRNGKVDTVSALFSETLAAYTAPNSAWTLKNVPSGGNLNSVSVSGAAATLSLTEGTGAASTAVGSFTVALKANTKGIRDAAGNQASFAAVAPADGAGPVPTAVADTNGGVNGKLEAGDTLSVTFSEALAAGSVAAAATVTEATPSGGGNATLQITGLTAGAVSLGSPAYLTSAGLTASFASSPMTLGNAGQTVTVTVGSSCSGTGCAALAAPSSAATFTFAPMATIADLAGNSATGTNSTLALMF